MPKKPKMRKATTTADQKRNKLQEVLEKLGAAVKRCLNEDYCFYICYSKKIHEHDVMCSIFLMSQQLFKP